MIVMALLLTSITGCQSAPVINEVSASPQTVCPGDTVRARFVSSAFDGGRMTVTPPPTICLEFVAGCADNPDCASP